MHIGFFSFRPQLETDLVRRLERHHRVSTFECHLNRDTAREAQDCDALCLFVQDEYSPEWLPNVKWVVLRATGSDRLNINPDIRFDRIADYGPQSIAEYALGMILDLAHPRVNILLQSDRGLVGRELMGKKAAVIGAGRIGSLLARYLTALGMDVHCYDITRTHADIKYASDLHSALRDSFVISLHLPLNKDTRNIIHSLAQLPRECILVNVGRAGLIHADVLLQGLEHNFFYGLGLDVYPDEDVKPKDNPFIKQIFKYKQHNVIVTSHVAYLTREALRRIHEQVDSIFCCDK